MAAHAKSKCENFCERLKTIGKPPVNDRRILRLIQVRQQERQHASRNLQLIRQKKHEAFNSIASQLKEEWVAEKKVAEKKLESKYLASVRSMGSSHSSAKNVSKLMQEHCDSKKINSRLMTKQAEERERRALEKQREENALRIQQQNAHLISRQHAIDIEKERAAEIASLPKSIPSFDSALVKPIVKIAEAVEVSSGFIRQFHPVPSAYSEKEAFDKYQSAHEAAEEYEKCMEEKERQRISVKNEQLEKARIRRKEALHKVKLDQQYTDLCQDLGSLQNQDNHRRKQNVAHLSKNIFLPPHRRAEEHQEQQEEMENQFERLYSRHAAVISQQMSLLSGDQPFIPSNISDENSEETADSLNIGANSKVVAGSSDVVQVYSDELPANKKPRVPPDVVFLQEKPCNDVEETHSKPLEGESFKECISEEDTLPKAPYHQSLNEYGEKPFGLDPSLNLSVVDHDNDKDKPERFSIEEGFYKKSDVLQRIESVSKLTNNEVVGCQIESQKESDISETISFPDTQRRNEIGLKLDRLIKSLYEKPKDFTIDYDSLPAYAAHSPQSNTHSSATSVNMSSDSVKSEIESALKSLSDKFVKAKFDDSVFKKTSPQKFEVNSSVPRLQSQWKHQQGNSFVTSDEDSHLRNTLSSSSHGYRPDSFQKLQQSTNYFPMQSSFSMPYYIDSTPSPESVSPQIQMNKNEFQSAMDSLLSRFTQAPKSDSSFTDHSIQSISSVPSSVKENDDAVGSHFTDDRLSPYFFPMVEVNSSKSTSDRDLSSCSTSKQDKVTTVSSLHENYGSFVGEPIVIAGEADSNDASSLSSLPFSSTNDSKYESLIQEEFCDSKDSLKNEAISVHSKATVFEARSDSLSSFSEESSSLTLAPNSTLKIIDKTNLDLSSKPIESFSDPSSDSFFVLEATTSTVKEQGQGDKPSFVLEDKNSMTYEELFAQYKNTSVDDSNVQDTLTKDLAAINLSPISNVGITRSFNSSISLDGTTTARDENLSYDLTNVTDFKHLGSSHFSSLNNSMPSSTQMSLNPDTKVWEASHSDSLLSFQQHEDSLINANVSAEGVV